MVRAKGLEKMGPCPTRGIWGEENNMRMPHVKRWFANHVPAKHSRPPAADNRGLTSGRSLREASRASQRRAGDRISICRRPKSPLWRTDPFREKRVRLRIPSSGWTV